MTTVWTRGLSERFDFQTTIYMYDMIQIRTYLGNREFRGQFQIRFDLGGW
jgi:hypothetical protein